MPSLIAQAAAPFIGSILLEATGLNGAMTVIVAAAALNALLAAGLLLVLRSLRGEMKTKANSADDSHVDEGF